MKLSEKQCSHHRENYDCTACINWDCMEDCPVDLNNPEDFNSITQDALTDTFGI